jgi:signal transduction histidine kinase
MGPLAAVALLPLGLLLWVGWRLLEQDRALAGQQVTQRIERAADIVVAALARAVSASEARLAAGAGDWGEGAVVVRFAGGGRVEAAPRGRLAWQPVAAPLEEASAAAFAQGEEFEFQKRDLKSAALFYRELAKSPAPGVRAGAGIRLARVLRGQGQLEEALAAYSAMNDLDGASVDRVPAALVALHASAELLAEMGRPTEARQHAQRLDEGLRAGRWLLTRPVYRLYSKQAAPEQEALSTAADQLWQMWNQRLPDAVGRTAIEVNGERLAVLWRVNGGEVRALLATPAYVDSQWLPAARAAAAGQQVQFALLDEDNARGYPAAKRRASETSLPWSVVVSSANPAGEFAQLVTRRRLFAGAFLLLALLVVAASLFTVRALNREFEVSRLQSDFVAAVSHEFRTPLTSLRQFTDMLREGREASEERKRLCYDALSRATDRLTRLVESLLDFGRLEAGARPYRLQPCDGEQLVRQVVKEFASEMETAGYQIEFAGQGPAAITADAEALTTALWNLLDNAVKYSPDHRTVEVRLEQNNGLVAISVRDHGLGVPAHEREAIFARFRRGEQAARLGIQGTGIGLAMVDHIVKAHQGRIELESEPGVGSRFTIVLPARA